MATLTVLQLTRLSSGLSLAGVAAAEAGDVFPNTGREAVVIKNAGASPMTMTVEFKATPDGLAVTDLSATVAAGATRIVGPFPPSQYSTDGQAGENASLTYSEHTDVTVAIVKF